MVDYIDPIKYVLYKSNLNLLLRMYKLPIDCDDLNENTTDKDYEKVARDLLQYYSATRGYITGGSGIPDEFKAAKIILQ